MRTPLLALVPAALLAACSFDGLPTPDDGAIDGAMAVDLAGQHLDGSSLDNAAPGDLAGSVCAALAAQVQQYLDENVACQRASDCARVAAPWGLFGECGTYVASTAVAGLMTLDDQWTMAGCTGPAHSCPAFLPGPVACTGGRCTSIGYTDRPVGSPCTDAAECHSEGSYAGTCLDASVGYPGGYCALPCTSSLGCPVAGTVCRAVPDGAVQLYLCLAECAIDADCRETEGYRCCPAWGGGGSPGSVCYPATCPK